MSSGAAFLIVYGVLPLSLVAYVVFGVLPPWWAARAAGLPIGAVGVLDMRVHGVNAWLVVQVLKRLQQLPLPKNSDPDDLSEGVYTQDVAEAYLHGVDLRAMIVAMDEALAQRKTFRFWDFVDADCRSRGVPTPRLEKDAPDDEPADPPEDGDRAAGDPAAERTSNAVRTPPQG